MSGVFLLVRMLISARPAVTRKDKALTIRSVGTVADQKKELGMK
jgi:hypothetical protein